MYLYISKDSKIWEWVDFELSTKNMSFSVIGFWAFLHHRSSLFCSTYVLCVFASDMRASRAQAAQQRKRSKIIRAFRGSSYLWRLILLRSDCGSFLNYDIQVVLSLLTSQVTILATSDIFCIFLHFFLSVSEEFSYFSLISSSDSRGRRFRLSLIYTGTWLQRLQTRLIDGIIIIYTIIPCSHLPNGIRQLVM